jgi:hypothetical protein
MDLKEWTSGTGHPETKPWLTPVVFSLEATSLVQNGQPVPYGLFSSLTDVTTQSGAAVILNGVIVGDDLIPSADIHAGTTVKVSAGGTYSNPTNPASMVVSLRTLDGSYTYAEAIVPVVADASFLPWVANFEVQFPVIGAAGTAKMRSSGVYTFNDIQRVSSSSDDAVIDTNVDLGFAIYGYVGSILQGATLIRSTGSATVVF